MIQHEMYATKENETFDHVYYEKSQVMTCVQIYIPIIPVTVTEDEEGSYWGWYEYEKDGKPAKLAHIYPTERQTQICSPDFFESNIAEGKGKILRLRIEERDQHGTA